MVVLIIGSEIAGLVGLFLGPVVTAILRDLFCYAYYRMQDDPLEPQEALDQVWQGGLLRFRL
jgi:predicted PurR-regulated permease PerM